MVNVKVWIHEG